MDFEEQRKIGFVKLLGSAYGHCAQGVAVIGLGEADKLGFFGVPCVVPVLGGELKGDFGGGCAGIAVEDFFEVLGDDFHQPVCQEDAGFIRQAKQCGMGDFFELGADGGVDLGDAVAVDVAPEAGNAVEIAAAIGINEMKALGGGDDQRIVIEPHAHGGERVPEVLAVERLQLGRSHVGVVNREAGFVNWASRQ